MFFYSRLIPCVQYSDCLHYFILENNTFENKIEGLAREILLDNLYTLDSYGWRWISFSDQFSNFPASISMMEQRRLYVHQVKISTRFLLLQWANTCLHNLPDENKTFQYYKRGIQKTTSREKSSIKSNIYTTLQCWFHRVPSIFHLPVHLEVIKPYTNSTNSVFVPCSRIFIMILFLVGWW